MGLYEKLPYANFHELNLDWVMKELRSFHDQLDQWPDDIKDAVTAWMDAHPGVTVTDNSVYTNALQDGAVTTPKLADESVTEEKLVPWLRRDYVTPQDFGAIANGQLANADVDTAAFQAALDSGKDVYVPTGNGEIYCINQTLVVPYNQDSSIPGTKKPMVRKIFGFGEWRTVGSFGTITLIPPSSGTTPEGSPIYTDMEYPLFTIAEGVQGLHIANLRFRSAGYRMVADPDNPGEYKRQSINVGTGFDFKTASVIDKDVDLVNCSLTDFYTCVKFKGRGFAAVNTSFTSSNNAVEIDFDGEDTFSSRGIRFQGCRFHANTMDNIHVKSGSAWGMQVENCLCDNGGRGFVVSDAAVTAKNWNISGNTLQGLTRSTGHIYTIWLNGPAEGVVINGNVFHATPGDNAPTNYLRFEDVVTGAVISNNYFSGLFHNSSHVDYRAVTFTAASSYCAINGNVAMNLLTTESLLSTASGCERFTVTGNTSSGKMLAGTTPTDSAIANNVSTS